jgi:hypothetical protein
MSREIDPLHKSTNNSPAQMYARHQVTLPYSSNANHPPSSPIRPGSSILTGPHPLTVENHACHWTGERLTNRGQCTSFAQHPATIADWLDAMQGQAITIDMLPDEVLLEIFDFCVDKDIISSKTKSVDTWQLLVHVCQRWRSVVFGSPRRLNLRLVCGVKTPVRRMLHVWPPLPLVIRDLVFRTDGVYDILAILERSADRVCQIYMYGLHNSVLKWVVAAMK